MQSYINAGWKHYLYKVRCHFDNTSGLLTHLFTVGQGFLSEAHLTIVPNVQNNWIIIWLPTYLVTEITYTVEGDRQEFGDIYNINAC